MQRPDGHWSVDGTADGTAEEVATEEPIEDTLDSSARDSGYASDDRGAKVYLLVTPLQCYYDYNFHRVDIWAARSQNHRLPFRRLQHWAIQVGDDVNGRMYEVTSYGSKEKKRDLKMLTAKAWRDEREGRPRRKLFITVTERSHDELQSIAHSVWDAVLEDQYRAMSRNCQSFAELFKGIIEDRELLTEEASTEVDDMPNSFNPFYAVTHLKQAKHAAARFTRRVFFPRKKFPSSPELNNDSQGDKLHHHSRLPAKKSKRWLEIVNEVSKQEGYRENRNVRGILFETNQRHLAEKTKPKQKPPQRRMTWT